ncbi:hypothetical protein [Clostridioides difficile]|uniref:Uncharacterized protein n=1 Tax=Clostridioides difficile TaxID=1496 RepID=A0AAN5VSA4_CLODI|nr:hypothetical protein [Clostridioides difficile]EIS9475942.1 hypothetical protein [Clostridioides difficile]EIS9655781.1 hypothetical protein [Clostridioides difficile]MBG0233283.1 hypothetical protein [Clostridioides difficile]MBZ1123067.1 hypothetical protein [Clostridioides difficile]MCG3620522.1 hypothetical protein [Clostridioides difficile]
MEFKSAITLFFIIIITGVGFIIHDESEKKKEELAIQKQEQLEKEYDFSQQQEESLNQEENLDTNDSDSNEEKPSNSLKYESNPINVFINYNVENKDMKPNIKIKTNLPNDTVLIVSLFKDEGSREKNYNAQSEVTIKDGYAETGEFSRFDEPLVNGKYEISISMSWPKFQSDSVRKIIGENGENLKGDLVEDTKSVDFSDSFYLD